MRHSKRVLLFTMAITSFGISTGFTQEIDEAAYSLQQRKYRMNHEFFIAPGILPMDAYEKSLVASGSYTYHWNDGWAIELAQVAYTKGISTSLNDDLTRFGFSAQLPPTLKYFGSINLMIKPVYRKMILFNRTILHGETFFLFGGGPFKFEDGFKPAVDVGIGIRIFINDWASFRADARNYIWFDGSSPNYDLMLALGLSFNYSGE